MVNDTEPRYRLVDSGGTVVGSLYVEGDGTLKLQEGTSGSDNEVSLATDGTFSAPAVSAGILEIDGGDAVSDFEFGTATLTGTGPASDGTVDSDESQTATVSFDSSFATTPKVILGGWSPVHPGVVISRDDITTSDFRLVYRNHSTTDRSSDQYTIDWLAVI